VISLSRLKLYSHYTLTSQRKQLPAEVQPGVQPVLVYLLIHVAESTTIKKIQPDGQSPEGASVGVGDGTDVGLGRDVEEAMGRGASVTVLVLPAAGRTGSVPVTETKLNRMRPWAEVVLSPRKRKFGVSYGSGKPLNAP
jgi:hypothetical protein